MFEVYTIEARQTIFAARDEAVKLGSPFIETQHILLGIASGNQGFLGTLLGLSDPENSIRDQIVAQSPTFESIPSTRDIPLSNETKRVLAYGAEEAHSLGNRHIGNGHLLLGLLRETDSFAARMLRERGAEFEAIRKSLANSPSHETPMPESINTLSPAGYSESVWQVHESGIREYSRDVRKETNSESFFSQYTERSRRCIFLRPVFCERVRRGQDRASTFAPCHRP